MGKIKDIHKACLNNDIKLFRKLIKDPKFKVNVRDNINFTPLMCACFSGNIEMVKTLLKMKSVMINARSRNGKTALIIASTRGFVNIVKLLVKYKANPNIKQFERSKKPCTKKTALNVALLCRHNNVSNYLKSKKVSKSNRYKNWKV